MSSLVVAFTSAPFSCKNLTTGKLPDLAAFCKSPLVHEFPENEMLFNPNWPDLLSKCTSKCENCETKFTNKETVFENFIK